MSTFYVGLSAFYGAIFILVGFFLPFFPVWLKSTELSTFEISLILAAPLFIRVIFTPFFSFVCDSTGEYRFMIRLLAWGTLISVTMMFVVDGFLQILLTSAVFSIFWTTIMPLTETIAMSGVRNRGLDYGRMRLWGSLTFILASFGGGYFLSHYGDNNAVWLFLMSSVLLVMGAYCLPAMEKKTEKLKAVPGNLHTVSVKDILAILSTPVFLAFLIGASFIQASHAVLYTFGSIHWQKLGNTEDIIGVLWAVGVLAETVLFAFSGRVVAVLGGGGLLLLAAIGGIFRWFIMAFDPSLGVLYPLQILHALTFGAGHLGAVILIGELVPQRYAATAQGVYAAFSVGVVMGLVTLLSGPAYQAYLGKSYMFMALVSLIALIALVIFHRIWDGKYVTVHK